MGKRERHALGAFFKGFGEEYTQRQAEGRVEQGQARAAWFRCIMEGGKEEDCLNMSGYRPEEDEVHGALSERERQVGVERQAGLEEEGKEYREKHIPLALPEIQELEIPRYRQDVSRTIFKPGQITTPVERKSLEEAETRRRKGAELKEKRTYEEEQIKEKRIYTRRQKVEDRKWQKELAVFKAELKGEAEEKLSETEKNLKYLKKKYTTLRTSTEVEKIKWKDLGLDVETMTYREFLNSLSDVWAKEVELELGRIGGRDPKEIYNKCRDEGGTPEECKIKAGI